MKRILFALVAMSIGLSACNRSRIADPIEFISKSDRQPAAEIGAEWLNTSENPSLGGSKGKVVLLNFWATWCGPCRMEMPSLIQAYLKFHDKGFEILGLSLDRPDPRRNELPEANKQKVQDFVTGQKVPYPIGLSNPTSPQVYQVEGIPATYLIDREGRVAARLIGLYPAEKIDDAIERLLAEK
jgi:thiol-disulfide isomerase/thioredoxin